jgi:hypothetical protein
MVKKAKELINVLDEMAGLSQRIYIDSNCSGLVSEVLKITSSTKIDDISKLTGKTNSTDKDIHLALQKVGTQQLIFVTKNCDHFNIQDFRLEAKYYLVCITKEITFNDILAKHLVNMCRYDQVLKSTNKQTGIYPYISIDYKYLNRLKNLIKK